MRATIARSTRARRKPVIGNRPPLDVEAEARRMPKLNPAVVDAIRSLLLQDRGMARPPDQAARLLALCVELYRKHEPFPHRAVAAEVIGGSKSKFTVDNAIRNALTDGYLSLVIETTEGHIQRRGSVRKERHFIPDKRLVEVADSVVALASRKQ